jgi:DNA polymerase I-like protein with 3'-5' exonuclease and polymerase domains
MRAISQFDLVKEKAVQKLSKQLKKEAKAASEDNSIGQTGARSTHFTSLMNNAIDQGLLCQKAEATVQEAIAAIERGQKPVIAVANTMAAFIKQYADDHNLNPGDAINISFGDVLGRYLERSRDVTIKDYEGNAIRRRMTDEELGDEALAAYEDASALVDEVDLSTIPLSSIDYIKWRLDQEGYRVGEITGRQHTIDYTSTGEKGYGFRSTKEVSPKAKVETVSQFNGGLLDVLILNRSGATGINLHASEKFVDQQQRHMIMAQPERDINQVMQMFGRVNRFGQVVEPEITLLMSDLPAEKRLGAILSKKMATLNANTTADRDSALSVSNVVDFLNPYGEEVVTEILEDNPELEAKLAFPSEGLQGETDTELISRVTGRIPLLPVKEQEELYSLIESETLDLIAQKQAMGESVLEAQQLDLDARTIAQMEVISDETTVRNEFTGPVYLEVVDAKVPVKPFTQLEVINTVRENLGLARVKAVAEHDFGRAEEAATQQIRQQSEQLRQVTLQYRSDILPTKHDKYARDKFIERLNSQYTHVTQVLKHFPPGRSVRVVSPEGNITYGVVAKVFQKGQNGSPAAPTNWRAEILTDNYARILTIPLTRFNRGKEGKATTITAQETNWEGQDIYAAFDLRQKTKRLERQIFQGNLLKAYEKYPNGKFLNYTDHTGGVRQGLIMPASFDIQESLRNEPVTFHDPRQVKVFLTEVTGYQGSVKTLDEVLTVKSQAAARLGSSAAGFVLQTPNSGLGARFSLDPTLIAACGSDFYSVSDRMEVVVPVERIDQVLNVLISEQGYALATFDFKDKAREFLGIRLPKLQVISNTPTGVEPFLEHYPERDRLGLTPEFMRLGIQTEMQGELERALNASTVIAPDAASQLSEAETDSLLPLAEAPSTGPLPSLPELFEQADQLMGHGDEQIPFGEDLPSLQELLEQAEKLTGKESILPAKEQTGGAERNVAKLLHEAGLASLVLQGEDFHLRIENGPYIPLVVERHASQLYFTHYLEQNGDTLIDSEMVFGIHPNGRLQFQETAVQNPFRGGESRYPDRGFAQLFSRNLLHQGFAEAARETLAAQRLEPELDVATKTDITETTQLQALGEIVELELPVSPELETPAASDEFEVVRVRTVDQLAQIIPRLSGVERLAIDTETSGLDPHQDQVELIQLAAIDQPVTLIQCANFTAEELHLLNEVLGSDAEKIIQNASFDLQMLKSIGLEVKGPLFDTMLASQVIGAGLNQSHKLEAIAHRYLNVDLDKTEQISHWGGELTQSQIEYAIKDVEVLLPLRDALAEKLEEKGLAETALLEFRAVIGVAEMEWNGMAIHRENLQAWAQTLRDQKSRLEPEIQALLQQAEVIQPSLSDDHLPTINLESSKQLLPALQQLGIPVTNTRKETLIPLQEQYPVVAQLLEYRRTAKALSTYAEGYGKLIHPSTGRLHPHINQCGAVTGRFSCTSPNLQNVPRDPRIKGCFEPALGNVLIKADYSQIELRIAAEVSGESRMKAAYRNGQDLHALTASLLLHKGVDQVTKDERRLAKAVNFGLIYGMGAPGFQSYAHSNYGVTLSLPQAEQYRSQYFKTYPGLIDWHDRVKAEQANSCRTLGGRLRQWDGTAPFTEIINAPVQGTSADITKLAIAELPEKLRGTGAKLLMQVHDEIVLEVPATQADRAGQVLVQTMVAAGQQFLKEVPVEVEAMICENWAGRNARPVPMLEAVISAKEVEPHPSPPPARSEEMKQLAATLRELPLAQVAQNLGLTQDKRDAQKWTNEGHTLSLYNNNHRFSDWATGVTGKYGAIDLVMHVQGSSYKDALSWLAEAQHLPQIPEQTELQKRPPTCNVRDESQWQAVQQYLTEERRLPPEIVEALHQQGIIAADSRQNVMFFRHELLDSFECGAAIGANLRGTIPNADGEFFKGLTPGTRREDGFFWIQQGDGTIDRVVLTESPIDAIAFAAMDESRDMGATVYLSTDGRGAIPVATIQQVLDGGGELILAQDSDRDGNRQAWSVVPQFPEHALIRIQPEGYKDWNDCLRDIPQPAWEGQAACDGLWNWYQVTELEERSEIAQIATEFLAPKNPRPLTDVELAAIAQATDLIQKGRTDEVSPMPAASREAELARGLEILAIAERAYAFAEQIGHLQFEGGFWTVQGHHFDIGYNPDNDNFFVMGKGESQMTAQRIGSELDPATTADVSEADLQAFRETAAALTKLGVQSQQSPAETVAIAQAKLEALEERGQETRFEPAIPLNTTASETNQPTRLVWEPSGRAITPTNAASLGKPAPQPTLDEMRLWYIQAREIGQSDRYLQRIEEVGKALAQEQQPLSAKALQAMAKDQAKWLAQVETVVAQAQTILALKGQPMAGGMFYSGQQCLLFERDGLLAATALGRGVQPTEGDCQQLPTEMLSWGRGLILKVEQGRVDCKATRITNSDAARFERFAQQLQLAAHNPAVVASYER